MRPGVHVADLRAGFTLIELVVSLTVFCLLAGLAVRGYLEVAAAGRRLAAGSDELWAHRAVRWVLREELSTGAAGADWSAHPPDSVRLRAFRSTGLVCAVGADSSLVVIRDGGRRPDPAKDSVLVLDAGGDWSVVALVGVGAGSCPAGAPHAPPLPGSPVERWRLGGDVTEAVLVRVFERGSYHLADRALRYRRGAGGRQPLTPEALAGAHLVDSAGVLRAVVPLRAGPPLELRLVESRPPVAP